MKLTIEQRRRRRRIDLFRALYLFVLIAMPLSVMYQLALHRFDEAPTLALLVDSLRFKHQP